VNEDDRLDALLIEYEARKQEETRDRVKRAVELEEARREGVDQLRRAVLDVSRDAAERLERAGHSVAYQEFLDDYPPGIRIHVWPKAGPLENEEPRRKTLELTWGEPHPGKLCMRRWSSRGLGAAVDQGSASAEELDSLWVHEQIVTFVWVALSGED
jgi:hypothetical protein